MKSFLKYFLEGLAIALAIYLVSKDVLPKEILLISLTGAVTFFVLDMFAPQVGESSRLGAGFGLGAKHVGFGENFNEQEEGGSSSSSEEEKQESEVLGYDSDADDLHEFSGATSSEIKKEIDLKNKRVKGSGFDMMGDENVEGFVDEGSEKLVKQARSVGQILTDQVRRLTDMKTKEGFSGTPYEDNKRAGGVLYSGDIIDLYESGTETSDNKNIVQRSPTSSDILVQSEIDKVKTNLSKLRLVKEDVDGGVVSPNRQVPISYGDTVFLRHNAYINSVNKSLFIKVGKRVHSHQSGPGFNRFTILNPADNSKVDNIKFGDAFVLKYEGSGADLKEGYLYKVTGSEDIPNSVKLQAHSGDISDTVDGSPKPLKLVADLIRVHELGNKQLYVGPKGTLFP